MNATLRAISATPSLTCRGHVRWASNPKARPYCIIVDTEANGPEGTETPVCIILHDRGLRPSPTDYLTIQVHAAPTGRGDLPIYHHFRGQPYTNARNPEDLIQ